MFHLFSQRSGVQSEERQHDHTAQKLLLHLPPSGQTDAGEDGSGVAVLAHTGLAGPEGRRRRAGTSSVL